MFRLLLLSFVVVLAGCAKPNAPGLVADYLKETNSALPIEIKPYSIDSITENGSSLTTNVSFPVKGMTLPEKVDMIGNLEPPTRELWKQVCQNKYYDDLVSRGYEFFISIRNVETGEIQPPASIRKQDCRQLGYG